MLIRTFALALVCVPLAQAASRAQETPATPAEKPAELKTLEEKASYALGLQIGARLRADGAVCDAKVLARGVSDAIKGAKPLLTEEEIATVMESFTKEMRARVSVKNKKEGEAFLAQNKAKMGVKTLPSGLQYEVLKAGDGPTPKATDVVKAHYHGTLIDGVVFDSSVERNEPIVIPVDGVIKGWQEALQMMKVGSKWKLVVPAKLAYGENPQPGSPIGPGSVLVFEVELLGIEK